MILWYRDQSGRYNEEIDIGPCDSPEDMIFTIKSCMNGTPMSFVNADGNFVCINFKRLEYWEFRDLDFPEAIEGYDEQVEIMKERSIRYRKPF